METQERVKIDIKVLILKYINHWHWFLISSIILLLAAFLYLRYADREYNVSSKVLIKDDKKGGGIDASSPFQDLGIFQSNQNIANEIEVLKGKSLMWRVMDDLNLQTTYYINGKLKSTELYGSGVPISLVVAALDSSAYGQMITIELQDRNRFSLSDQEGTKTFEFGKAIQRPYGEFTVIAKYQNLPVGKEIGVQFNNIQKVGNSYNSKIQIQAVNKEASVLAISMVDPVPQKAADIIDKLIEVYQREAVEDKNQIATNTVNFIDERLAVLVKDLVMVERNVEEYKKENKISNVGLEAQAYIQEASQYSRQLSDFQTRISVVESMRTYMDTASTEGLVPGTMGIQDATLAGLTQRYNELQQERQRLLKTVQPANPIIISIDEQLTNLRENISENLTNIKQSLVINRNAMSVKTGGFESRIVNVPTVERNLLEIQRQQGIKESLYSYLLQKREESAISLASAVSNVRIIDQAIVTTVPVKPKGKMIYLAALMLAFGLPVGLIYAKDLLNDKVESIADIEQITTVPILGELVHSMESQALVVNKNLRTEVAELFRLIRTNLQFAVRNPAENKVMVVTSSMTGEGKTFFCINMGASLAITGKRTVLLEFDIRKPKLLKDLEMNDTKPGITNYLVNSEIELDQIIRPVRELEGLYVIGAGPIPPNPAELIMSERISQMIDKLRADFDHVIIDTSPVGQVADAFTLGAFADLSVYIVRYNYTFKQQLHIVKDVYENKKLRNLMVVMNDAKKENGYSYGYGYGYGYGYDKDMPKTWKSKVKEYLARKYKL